MKGEALFTPPVPQQRDGNRMKHVKAKALLLQTSSALKGGSQAQTDLCTLCSCTGEMHSQ